MGRFFVTGATGFIGGRVTRQLIAAGHRVATIARTPSRARDLIDLGGDFTLRELAAGIKKGIRKEDLFARFGGEEFGILLKDCDMEQAQQRADQMREAIARISMHEDGMEPGVSASFGVAATPTSGYGLSQLLSDADAALYRAKGLGRNRVCLAE